MSRLLQVRVTLYCATHYIRTYVPRCLDIDQIRVRPKDRRKSISCRERSCSVLQIFEIGSQFHSYSYAMGSEEVIPADINYILGDKKFNFNFHICILQYIVTDFFLSKQPDALIIQIYSVIKLYMFRASSLPIIRSSLLYIRHW